MTTIIRKGQLDPPGLNYTPIIITISLNQQVRDAQGRVVIEPSEVPSARRRYLEDKTQALSQRKNVRQVFGKDVYIYRVETGRVGIEIGGKKRNLHVHWFVEISHFLPDYSLGKLSDRVREFYTNTFIERVYVNVTLQGRGSRSATKGKQYATKEERAEYAKPRELDPMEYDRLTNGESFQPRSQKKEYRKQLEEDTQLEEITEKLGVMNLEKKESEE